MELSLTIRGRNSGQGTTFQKLIRVAQGYVRAMIPVAEIIEKVDLSRLFEVEIVPNECSDKVLYFGLMDFVKERHRPAIKAVAPETSKKWKCVVWDLDNTIWHGTLIEDGPANLKLRSGVVRVIEETDRRGILHSVASKNNYEDAMRVLTAFGISEYFLCPQIGWQPKSASIGRIAKLLNIGIDTIAFVDDQTFEREEVRSVLPHVALVDAKDCEGLPNFDECQVPVTEESKQRRLMYKQQELRDTTLQSYAGDYVGFLRDCRIELQIGPLKQANVERVYELAQRTNQMNFSGNRYPITKLEEIMISKDHDTYVMKCADRFGSYGIVGFAVVDKREPRLLDLMFSCRIQSKRVEHAFFSYLLIRHERSNASDFYANYRKTDKNTPAGKVFDEIGFEIASEANGVTSLVFRNGRRVPDDQIVKIISESD